LYLSPSAKTKADVRNRTKYIKIRNAFGMTRLSAGLKAHSIAKAAQLGIKFWKGADKREL
jgi:hypothetical protein